MKQFHITGMSCAACAARVEKAVSGVEGVTSCAVSLLTNSMGVEGTADDMSIIRAVREAGYGASVRGEAAPATAEQADDDPLRDHETPALKRRLVFSVLLLVLLMYVSMGHMMWGWPLPVWFEDNHVAMGLVQLLLTGAIMLLNHRFFTGGFMSLLRRSPNMDTLVALGASASFAYSVYALFAMTDAQLHGGPEAAMVWMDQFYFESAAMILTLITLGKMLEARSKGKTTDALRSLMKLAPRLATVIREDREVEIPAADVRPGDVFIVRPGEQIPVDGVVQEGDTAVNESALTGESIPVDKAPGDAVSAGTMNQSGFIRCVAKRVGEDTTLSQIIRLVSDAAATKAPIAKVADRVSGVFVPAVMGIALVTLAAWLLAGREFGYALARAISVLVISCPCALGLATPVAIMVGSGVGARHGILFKTAVSLEECGKTRIVALDKTGTITRGKPALTDILPCSGVSEDALLTCAYALESRSEHPLARAIVAAAEQRALPLTGVQAFRAVPGNGLEAEMNGARVAGGSLAFIERQAEVTQDTRAQAERVAMQGKTPVFFAQQGRLLGMLAVADTIRPDSAEAVRELHHLGVRVVMLTGDNRHTAEAIGREAGVDEVIAGVLPSEKENAIRSLQSQGRVMMVGDGVNDAPALTRADVGVAIGAGTDVAIDAADIVLMNASLMDAASAIRLSRHTLRNIKQNLFWAFIYNLAGIPLAAGVFAPWLGWELSPMFGAAAMSLSSLCVVSNALRLNFIRLSLPAREGREHEKQPSYQRIMLVEGMMCHHCEMTVESALTALDGVVQAKADHAAGTVTVTLARFVADNALREAVEREDYVVRGFRESGAA